MISSAPTKQRKKRIHDESLATRFRLLLEELGPTFIKLGQIASTRNDLFPLYLIKELERLQNQVPPFPYKQVQASIEGELGASIETLFTYFEKEPLATASIGQVHQAVLHSGEDVAVKVQRPEIDQVIHTDLAILHDLIRLAEDKLEWASRYRLTSIFQEFANALRLELNYSLEYENAERLQRQKGQYFFHTDRFQKPLQQQSFNLELY